MPKWVLLTLTLILLLVVLFLLAMYFLRPQATAWCCMEPQTACLGVGAYPECAEAGGKIFHADQTTCDKLCSLLPTE